jgi:hypothetical protein
MRLKPVAGFTIQSQNLAIFAIHSSSRAPMQGDLFNRFSLASSILLTLQDCNWHPNCMFHDWRDCSPVKMFSFIALRFVVIHDN